MNQLYDFEGSEATEALLPSIHITEITAANFPSDAGYVYKCRLMVEAPFTSSLEKDLDARRNPSWMINVTHPGHCTVSAILDYRAPDSDTWHRAGAVGFETEKPLERDTVAVVTLPIETWAEAPRLRLKVRFYMDHQRPRLEGVESELLPVLPRGTSGRQILTNLSVPVDHIEFPEAIDLTPQEEVIVKDTWNKFLAYKELSLEMLYKRLLVVEPDLESIFGTELDAMMEELHDVIDLAVRNLNPHTERILREAYRGIHTDEHRECSTIEEYASYFANMGMRPRHWVSLRDVWLWVLPTLPYLEEYEGENIAKGEESAPYRFFTRDLLAPMLLGIQLYDQQFSGSVVPELRNSLKELEGKEAEAGQDLFQGAFEQHPEILPSFGRFDVSKNADRPLGSLEDLAESMVDWNTLMPELREVDVAPSRYEVPTAPAEVLADPALQALEKHLPEWSSEIRQGWQSLFKRLGQLKNAPKKREEVMLARAAEYFGTLRREFGWDERDLDRRLLEVRHEIASTGTYTHTYEEMAYGAQLAWRNAPKCVGRMQWKNLLIRDMRHITEPDAMFEQLLEHLRISNNNGKLLSVLSMFRPRRPLETWGPRIWNSQLIRFAAYRQPDGSIMGDPANLGLTEAILQMGWNPPSPKSDFDVLPLVIEVPGKQPKMYELPEDVILMVNIRHPTVPEFEGLGLKWNAVPAIANFRLAIGGITYGCLPFNGWYLCTEIARDITDTYRMNRLPQIAEALKLDTSTEQTMWRDEAFLQLNKAIVYSFQKDRVIIADQHNISRQFLTHDLREKQLGREVPGQWSWVIPPLGGTTIPLYHHEMRDFLLEPQYHYAADKWAVQGAKNEVTDFDDSFSLADETADEAQPVGSNQVLILYASETGTGEHYARLMARQLEDLHPELRSVADYNPADLQHEALLLMVLSTTGDGEVPTSARPLFNWLEEQRDNSLTNLHFAVLTLGNTLYRHSGAAGEALEKQLERLGGRPIAPLHKADSLKDSTGTFNQWLTLVGSILGQDPTTAHAKEVNTLGDKLNVVFFDGGDTPGKTSGTELTVVERKALLSSDGDRSTHRLTLDLAGSGLTYGTGDLLAIFPDNPMEQVQRLCQRLSLNPKIHLLARYVDEFGMETPRKLPFTTPTTVERFFAQEVDLSLREPMEFLLASLARTARDAGERQQLENWVTELSYGASDPRSTQLRQTLQARFASLVDLLETFPSIDINLRHLLEILPRQQPRIFGIASSASVRPEQVDVLVSLVTVPAADGKKRPGLCSGFLSGVAAGDKVRVSVIEGRRPLPEEPDAPLIMVTAGAGLGPILGLLEERQGILQGGNTLSSAHLYFGCRTAADQLAPQDLDNWRRDGVLSTLGVATSREQPQTHVQDLLANDAADVSAILTDPKGRCFLVGDAKMIDDTVETFEKILRQKGGLSPKEAADTLEAMRQDKRLVTQNWGVQLRYTQAIEALRKSRYSLAKHWLAKRASSQVTVG